MVGVAGKVMLVNEKVVVAVQLPELAVNDVEVLITEVLCHLVDVVFYLQCLYDSQEVWTSQFCQADLSTPWLVNTVVDPANHLHSIVLHQPLHRVLELKVAI